MRISQRVEGELRQVHPGRDILTEHVWTPTTFRPCLTSNLRRVFTPEEAIGTLFHTVIAAEPASNALEGPPLFEPPKGMCCQCAPRVIQSSFTTVRCFTPNYVNLAGLLCILKSQVKTSDMGGVNFNRSFGDELPCKYLIFNLYFYVILLA